MFKNKKYNVCLVIFIVACGMCFKFRRIKRKIFLGMMNRNMNRMDFFKLIQTKRKLDIITYLLFNEKQLAMIKFVEKEQMSYDILNDSVLFHRKYSRKFNYEKRLEISRQIYS